MESMQNLLKHVPEAMRTRLGALEALSLSELEQKRAEMHNQTKGTLEGYDCPLCLNRGYFLTVREDGNRVSRECSCMDTRRSLSHMQKSGLASLLERYTFQNWQTRETWQKEALVAARQYAKEPAGRWFLMTGRPGCGKTHLCTALCGALMQCGKRVQYMLWRDMSVRIKALVGNEEAYRKLVDPLKSVPVLYIDDFWKAAKEESGAAKVTAGDMNLAFEILNARYNEPRLLTILSSERSLGEILSLDEAIGSRIRERAKDGYLALQGADNWRLHV